MGGEPSSKNRANSHGSQPPILVVEREAADDGLGGPVRLFCRKEFREQCQD